MLELTEPKDDGLIKMSVGEWSLDKHHFLRRYVDAFTVAMKKKKWSGLHYIDLFAGPGLLKIENTNKLIWGSPLIAAQCDLLNSVHLCEKKPEYVSALESRIQNLGLQERCRIYSGDANSEVKKVVNNIPPRSLSLAFLDPFGLHLHYTTLQALAKKRVDLIIFFPDHIDALRNWEFVYHKQEQSNLDKVIGPAVDWRSIFESNPGDKWAEKLRDLYVTQIKKLGYNYYDFERISNRKSPLYLLLYFSHSSVGLKIWRGISETKPGGQRTLGFD